MPSAVDFFPPNMSVLVNFETSLSLNLGSGMMRRLGTSRRRGMGVFAGISWRKIWFWAWSGAEESSALPHRDCHALGRLTPYLERFRLRLTLFVDEGPMAPEASKVPRTTW